jgi:hypothetical protein
LLRPPFLALSLFPPLPGMLQIHELGTMLNHKNTDADVC